MCETVRSSDTFSPERGLEQEKTVCENQRDGMLEARSRNDTAFQKPDLALVTGVSVSENPPIYDSCSFLVMTERHFS